MLVGAHVGSSPLAPFLRLTCGNSISRCAILERRQLAEIAGDMDRRERDALAGSGLESESGNVRADGFFSVQVPELSWLEGGEFPFPPQLELWWAGKFAFSSSPTPATRPAAETPDSDIVPLAEFSNTGVLVTLTTNFGRSFKRRCKCEA